MLWINLGRCVLFTTLILFLHGHGISLHFNLSEVSWFSLESYEVLTGFVPRHLVYCCYMKGIFFFYVLKSFFLL